MLASRLSGLLSQGDGGGGGGENPKTENNGNDLGILEV